MPEKVLQTDIFRPVFPSPAALITSVGLDGKPNIITLGETFNLSIRNPPIVGIAIAPERYSHDLISQAREFVVNLPTSGLLEKVLSCGSCSGRDTDKFAKFGLTPLPAREVKPPLIAECPINLECQLIDIQQIGDHDLFKGLVVAEHIDADLLNEQGRLDPDLLDFFSMARGAFFARGPRLKPKR